MVVTVGGTSVRNSKSCRDSSSLSVFPPRLSPVWWWRWWLVGAEELLSNLRAMSWDVKRCSRALRNFSSWKEISDRSDAFRFRNDLPAVDDNVHAGVEDKEQVWEIGQDVAPEKHFQICQTKEVIRSFASLLSHVLSDWGDVTVQVLSNWVLYFFCQMLKSS